MNMVKKALSSRMFFPILFLVGYICLYYKVKDLFLFTPDYTSTDILHYTISYKYYLWQAIRRGVIPFWTQLLDGGFPLLAESPVGMLFLPYYIIFPLFSTFSHALAFLFCFHLFIMSLGMYLFLRQYSAAGFLAFILSNIFVWNGAIMFRWVHLVVLQAFSFTPLLFWLYIKWNKSEKHRYLIFIALVLNQMILVGYIQAVFIALLGLFCFAMVNRQSTIQKTLLELWALAGGFFLSLPQIIPTLQLSQFASRPIANTYEFAVSVPFNINNICSFFLSDCMGTAQNGTYNSQWQMKGIYWENTPYMGIFFMILVILASAYIFITHKKNRDALIYLVLFIVFLLLALGKNSPLYFIFSIFPFSMFRTPPRYLLMATFFLVTFASLIFKQISHKNSYIRFLIYIILIVNFIHLVLTAFHYHLFIHTTEIYKSIAAQKIIPKNSSYITYGTTEEWNKVFVKSGWSTKGSIANYLAFSQAGLPNSNLITGQQQFDIYASMPLRRSQYIHSVIIDSIESTQSSTFLPNLLHLYGIGSIVTYKPIDVPSFTPVQQLKNEGKTLITYQSNKNETDQSLVYIPKIARKVFNMEEVEKYIYSNKMTMEDSLVESLPGNSFINTSPVKVGILEQNDLYIKSKVSVEKDSFVVYRIGWYPEWELSIDGVKAPIYRTNLIHMGFVLPSGNHIVELRYVPKSFYLGCLMSLVFVGASVSMYLKTIKRRK